MAALSIQTISESGLEATYASASAGGDTFVNDTSQRTFLHVKNGGGSDITVTVTSQHTTTRAPGFGVVAKANLSITVTAGEERMIGPFPPAAFNNASGAVAVGYSAVTSVTVAALKLAAT